jgi:hypothetical protein
MQPQEILAHLVDAHGVHGVKVLGNASACSGGCYVDVPNLCARLHDAAYAAADSIITAQDSHFVLRWGILQGHYYAFVQCLDTATKSNTFDYRIRLAQKRLAAQWDGPVTSVSCKIRQLLDQKRCLWLSGAAAEDFAADDADDNAVAPHFRLHVQIALAGKLP